MGYERQPDREFNSPIPSFPIVQHKFSSLWKLRRQYHHHGHSIPCSSHGSWNFTCHTLTAASAPAPASLPSATQKTALTPPGTAFMIAIFCAGFRTLHTYMWVSNEPEAQCSESAVQHSELTRAAWKDQRVVITSRFATS